MKKKIFIALFIVFSAITAQAQQKTFKNADATAFAKALTATTQVLDVRTPREYSGGHIEGAKNINLFQSDFLDQVAKTINKKQTVYVYCHSGGRSARASQILTAAGYDVVNLLGGIMGWESKGFKTVK